MSKLNASRARERQRADPNRIDSQAIAATFPAAVSRDAIQEFVRAAKAAVMHYLQLLPTGQPGKRKHRPTSEQPHPSTAHRPVDSPRRALIGDLYDAYMTARGSVDPDIVSEFKLVDPDTVRGFKKAADAVLTSVGLRSVSEHEQAFIRERIKAFAAIDAAFTKESEGC